MNECMHTRMPGEGGHFAVVCGLKLQLEPCLGEARLGEVQIWYSGCGLRSPSCLCLMSSWSLLCEVPFGQLSKPRASQGLPQRLQSGGPFLVLGSG